MTSVSEPIQYCALAPLKDSGVDNTPLIKRRLELIMTIFHRLSIPYMKPEGSFYVFPKIGAESNRKDLSLVEKFLQSGVAVAPGSAFGNHYHNFLRISACQPEDSLKGWKNLRGSGLRNSLVIKNNRNRGLAWEDGKLVSKILFEEMQIFTCI